MDGSSAATATADELAQVYRRRALEAIAKYKNAVFTEQAVAAEEEQEAENRSLNNFRSSSSSHQASSSSAVCRMPWLCRSRVPFWRVERLLSIEMDETGRIADHVMQRIDVLAAKLRETCAALGIEVIVYRFASSMPLDRDVERWFPGSLRHTAHQQLGPRHYFGHAGSSHLNSSGNREIATYLARTLRARGVLGER